MIQKKDSNVSELSIHNRMHVINHTKPLFNHTAHLQGVALASATLLFKNLET